MTNAIRHDFHSDLATIVSNEIQYNRANYYYFLGKVEPWGINDNVPSLMQADSDSENALIRTNALYFKKISANDVALVTTRYNWESGTVYSRWDHTKNMQLEKFYCMTNDDNVYKCLNNNNGAPSTVKPTGQSLYEFKTSDGYLWKYMYNIPSFKRTRFTTSLYMPVQKALTNSFYNRGSADDVAITNPGSGYTDTQLTFVNVSGSVSGSGAVGTIIANATGTITGVNITNGGSGYTAGVAVTVNTVSGYGAVGTAVISGGVITNVTFSGGNGGFGYVTGQSLVFTVGGAILIPSVSRVTGSITSVNIINSGAGYTSTPTLTVSSSGGGGGKYGNVTAVVKAVLYQGKIVNVTIEDPGIGYPADTDTDITVQGDGTGASFTPVMYNGSIVDVIVENSGSGYTSMALSVVGTGTGAKLTPIISASDYTSNQSLVEQSAVKGAIYHIEVTDGGNNYTDTTTCTIIGDGTGCTATPIVNGSGVITHVIVNTYGSGYTYANVIFNDINRGVVGELIDGVAYAVLPPVNGHGYDAVTELYGTTVAINTSLRQDTILNQINQDYRQYGIIKNPTNLLDTSNFIENNSLIAYVAQFSSVAGLVLDEILMLNNIKFRVIAVNSNNVHLQQMGSTYNPPVGQLIAENENTRTYNSVKIISAPNVNKYSGKLLYISNENPFSFTEDQGIIIKTFLKF